MTNSTLSGNSAARGGGIATITRIPLADGAVTLTHSTLTWYAAAQALSAAKRSV